MIRSVAIWASSFGSCMLHLTVASAALKNRAKCIEKPLVLCSNSFLGLLLAEGLVLFFAFEAHGMMIRSVNPNLQLEQSTSPDISQAGNKVSKTLP